MSNYIIKYLNGLNQAYLLTKIPQSSISYKTSIYYSIIILYYLVFFLLSYDRFHYPLSFFEARNFSYIADYSTLPLQNIQEQYLLNTTFPSAVYSYFVSLVYYLTGDRSLVTRFFIFLIQAYVVHQANRAFLKTEDNVPESRSRTLVFYSFFNPYLLFAITTISPTAFVYATLVRVFYEYRKAKKRHHQPSQVFILLFGSTFLYPPIIFFAIIFFIYSLIFISPSLRWAGVHLLYTIIFLLLIPNELIHLSNLIESLRVNLPFFERFSTIYLQRCSTYGTNIWYTFDLRLFDDDVLYNARFMRIFEQLYYILKPKTFGFYLFSDDTLTYYIYSNISNYILSVNIVFFMTTLYHFYFRNRLFSERIFNNEQVFFASIFLIVLFLSGVFFITLVESRFLISIFTYLIFIFSFFSSNSLRSIYGTIHHSIITCIMFLGLSLFDHYYSIFTYQVLFDIQQMSDFIKCIC